jgi:hypothetical protein
LEQPLSSESIGKHRLPSEAVQQRPSSGEIVRFDFCIFAFEFNFGGLKSEAHFNVRLKFEIIQE